MTTYYEPSHDDYKEVWPEFMQLLQDHARRPFKVGRCAWADANGLEHRPEYQDSSHIHGIWIGPRGKCAAMEEELILWSMQHFPNLCQNEKVGGGPQSEEDTHLVYVVFW